MKETKAQQEAEEILGKLRSLCKAEQDTGSPSYQNLRNALQQILTQEEIWELIDLQNRKIVKLTKQRDKLKEQTERLTQQRDRLAESFLKVRRQLIELMEKEPAPKKSGMEPTEELKKRLDSYWIRIQTLISL